VEESEEEGSEEEADGDEDVKDKAPKKKNAKLSEEETREKNNSDDAEESELLSKFKAMGDELKKKHSDHRLTKGFRDFERQEHKRSQKLKEKRDKKDKGKNFQKFNKLIREKSVVNDNAYFKKLGVDEQRHILSELENIAKLSQHSKPHRIALLESDIPNVYKASALKKMNTLRFMQPGDGEYYKIKHWVDAFMEIPFDHYCKLPVSIEDGVDKCHEFMESAKKRLDEAVHGLNDAYRQP